ncbi:hypothetical protein EUAN_24180 [Andreesenia angusta]|uniref:Ylxp-like protein n=1 Tax=Andreesenia angusta TaxID=39480 RepID=A0A1S1V3D6_9FIRM|nr:DUF503 domain-containing protein [Andreesenia angusta]OHW61216.1 hypothetical protein EUAN_24180 [Andreesenia angusta]
MVVGVMKVKMRAAWVHSLKEKRMELRSLTSKVSNKYNVSVAEVESQDTHQDIVLGVSCVTTDTAHANSILDNILNYIEANSEAEIYDYEIEIISF